MHKEGQNLDSCIAISARLSAKHSVFMMKSCNSKECVCEKRLATNEVKLHSDSTYRNCSVARQSSCGISHKSESSSLSSLVNGLI